MEPEKGKYFELLKGNLSKTTIDSILDHIKSLGLRIDKVPESLLGRYASSEKLTKCPLS
jgi:hypothetical protein